METLLIAALIVVAAAGLYVALTFSKRTRQSTTAESRHRWPRSLRHKNSMTHRDP